MIQEISKLTFQLDPRIKFLLILIIGFMMFYFTEIGYMIFILGLFIFLSIFEGVFNESFKYFLIFSILLIVNLSSAYITNIWFNIALSTLLYVVERLFVFGIIGFYIFKTTKLSKFISALESLKIPKYIILPFSVMFRFLPTILEEYAYLRDSMKIRGINFSAKMIIKKPLDYMEYIIVPILIRSFKISDELSAYAMLRGLDSEKQKTKLFDLKFAVFDYLIISGVSIFTFIFYIGVF